MDDPKKTIEALVAGGDLNKALELALLHLPGEHHNELRQMAAEHSGLEKQLLRGEITYSESGPARNRLNRYLLQVLDAWHPGGAVSALQAAVEALDIPPDNRIGEIYRFNCDRRKTTLRFKSDFRSKRGGGAFQFYYICGCPFERPESFARRLVHEILRDDATEDEDLLRKSLDELVFFPFSESRERIGIKALPFSEGNLAAGKGLFKQDFESRFGVSLDEFCKNGSPRLAKYRYVVSLFKTSAGEWDDEEETMNRYLGWLMESFSQPLPGMPEFLFFIVVDSPRLWQDPERHSPLQRKMLYDLRALCRGNEKMVLADLVPVEIADDLYAWFTNLPGLGDVNPNKISAVVRAMEHALGPAERLLYEQEQRMHMKDIEPVQDMVWQVARR